jgi:hypothetical protein
MPTPLRDKPFAAALGDESLVNAWVNISCERFADPCPRQTEKSGMIPGT